jgi:hypothetical protein
VCFYKIRNKNIIFNHFIEEFSEKHKTEASRSSATSFYLLSEAPCSNATSFCLIAEAPRSHATSFCFISKVSSSTSTEKIIHKHGQHYLGKYILSVSVISCQLSVVGLQLSVTKN